MTGGRWAIVDDTTCSNFEVVAAAAADDDDYDVGGNNDPEFVHWHMNFDLLLQVVEGMLLTLVRWGCIDCCCCDFYFCC